MPKKNWSLSEVMKPNGAIVILSSSLFAVERLRVADPELKSTVMIPTFYSISRPFGSKTCYLRRYSATLVALCLTVRQSKLSEALVEYDVMVSADAEGETSIMSK